MRTALLPWLILRGSVLLFYTCWTWFCMCICKSDVCVLLFLLPLSSYVSTINRSKASVSAALWNYLNTWEILWYTLLFCAWLYFFFPYSSMFILCQKCQWYLENKRKIHILSQTSILALKPSSCPFVPPYAIPVIVEGKGGEKWERGSLEGCWQYDPGYL